MNDESDRTFEEDLAWFKARLLPRGKVTEPSASLAGRIMGAVADEAFMEQVRADAVQASPSPGLARRVMDGVRAEAARERRRARLWRIALASAACVAAAFIALFASPFAPGRALSPSAPHPDTDGRFVDTPFAPGRALSPRAPHPDTDGRFVKTSLPNQAPSAQQAPGRDAPTARPLAAADWLASRQCPDGTWSPSETGGNEAFRPALTALALMALQRHAPVRHADAIARAEQALVAMQTDDGAFGDSSPDRLYNHSFATYALLTLQNARGEGLTPTLKRAIAFSLRSQNHFGAWDYAVQRPGNAALTVWQLAILVEAGKAGWRDDAGQMRRGLAWLRRLGQGGYFDYREDLDRKYTPRSGSDTLTDMATATLLEAAGKYPEFRETAETAVASLQLARRRLDKGRDALASSGRDLYATVMAMLDADRG